MSPHEQAGEARERALEQEELVGEVAEAAGLLESPR